MEDLKKALQDMVDILKKKNNSSFHFFENLLFKIDDSPKEVLSLLLSSYSIIQYADFNSEEELLMDHIWSLARYYNNSLSK